MNITVKKKQLYSVILGGLCRCSVVILVARTVQFVLVLI